MGWFYPNHCATRHELVKYLTESRGNGKYKAERKYFCGNVLWVLWEPTDEGRKLGLHSWIECDLMHVYRRPSEGIHEWGYKPMDESMGPFYYSCPKAFLVRATETANPEWREGVMEYWKKRKERARIKRERRRW